MAPFSVTPKGHEKSSSNEEDKVAMACNSPPTMRHRIDDDSNYKVQETSWADDCRLLFLLTKMHDQQYIKTMFDPLYCKKITLTVKIFLETFAFSLFDFIFTESQPTRTRIYISRIKYFCSKQLKLYIIVLINKYRPEVYSVMTTEYFTLLFNDIQRKEWWL